MAWIRKLFYVVAILASAHSILAEDTGPPNHQNPHNEGGRQNPFGNMMDGFSSLGNFGGSGGNPFSGFASAFGIPSFPGFGSRQGHRPPHPEFDFEMSGDEPTEVSLSEEDGGESEEGPESRLFFSSLFNTRLRTCNYTTQPGASCLSCREVLRCRPNNVGTVKRCGFLFSYCNNGRCSLFPGAQCNPTTTTVAADTTTVAADTTTVAADTTTVAADTTTVAATTV